MSHHWQKAFKLLAIHLAVAALAFAQNANLSRDLTGVSSTTNVNVIVRFKHPPSDADHQRILQLSNGGALLKKLRSVKGGEYKMPAAALARIAADPGVAYVSPDRMVGGKLDLTAAAVNASVAWSSGWDGKGSAWQ